MAESHILVLMKGSTVEDELDLLKFLEGRSIAEHEGWHNQYVYFRVDLSEEDILYISLRFGNAVSINESGNENMSDLIIRLFDAGHRPRLAR